MNVAIFNLAFSYFAERGTWDELLGTFINSDGDPTQFSVCHGRNLPRSVTIIHSSFLVVHPGSCMVCSRQYVTAFMACFSLLKPNNQPLQLSGMARLHHVLFSVVSSRCRYWFLDFYWSLFQVLCLVGNLVSYGRKCLVIAWAKQSRILHFSKNLLISIQEVEDTEDPLYSPVYSARQSFSLQTPPPPPRTPRDLTNMKLAQNQTELSKQIEELTATVEIQGRMLQRLLEIMAENPGKESSTNR